MTQQIAASRRVNRRCNRGQALAAVPGDSLWRQSRGWRRAAILKPAPRVRVLGVVLMPARRWRRCAGCFRAKKARRVRAG